jgi:inosine/xanthosine triphosphatase
MKLNVGSKNQTKLIAVKEAVALYPDIFPNAEVISIVVNVEEFGHPKSLDETIKGAIDRAKAAFVDCSYSFGIEGGLMAVPYTKTGFMEVGVCAIYDGKECYLGLSSAFEWPPKVFDMIVNHNKDGSQAVREAGLTKHEKVGAAGGVISVLSHDKANRKDKTIDSIVMAMIHLQNPELYGTGQ